MQRAQLRARHSLQAQQTVKKIGTLSPTSRRALCSPDSTSPGRPAPEPARELTQSRSLGSVWTAVPIPTRGPPGEGLGVWILQRAENIPPAHLHPELCLPWCCHGRRREARGAQGTVGRKGERKRDAVMGAQRPRETQLPHAGGAQ